MAASFATAQDVAARWRPLTPAETDTANVLCADASNLIRAEFPGIDDQVTAGAVDAAVLTQVCAGMVKRAMRAPADGVTSESNNVGPFSHSQTYANPLGNVFLTEADRTLILGYQVTAQNNTYANTTRRGGSRMFGDYEIDEPGYIYSEYL